MEFKKVGIFLAVVTLGLALALNWNSIIGVDLPGINAAYLPVVHISAISVEPTQNFTRVSA